MSNADQDCWICRAPATTGEHITKKTDLKLEFGDVTPQAPLYLHRVGQRRSKRVFSFDAKDLKPFPLCPECNNHRTQPHDFAWAKLSTFLKTRNPEPETIVRASCVFPDSTAQQMLNVHLYFVKQLGCRLIKAEIPVDRVFSDAILNGTAHPHLYLRVGRIIPFPVGKKSTGGSEIHAIRPPDYFGWLYGVGCMGVHVLHATNAALLPQGAWHPRLNTDSLVIAKFS
jgi:hypothetical protein